MVSHIVETEFGRFRAVVSDGRHEWLFECPGCGTWAHLDDDQWNGRVSVNHSADGCPGGYHETHDFEAAMKRHTIEYVAQLGRPKEES